MKNKKVKSKKIWSFILVMAMVIGILPQIAMPVQAVGEVYAVLKNDNKVYETNSDNTRIDGAEISDKETITHLYVATDVTKIEDNAFRDCIALTTVELAEVTLIGENAFNRCTALTTVNMTKVTIIEDHAFYNCTSLTNVALAEATSIGNSAFNECESLTTVKMTKVTTIGGSAFSGCIALSTVHMSNVTLIGNAAFNYCTSLTTLEIPEVTAIGDSAFRDCKALTTVHMSKVTSIGVWAFSGCKALTTVYMSNATSIGNCAFRDSTALANLTVGAAPPTVGTDVFKDCPANRTLTIDGGNTQAAIDKYKAVDDGNTSDNSWYGWKLPEPPVYAVLKNDNKVYETNSDNTRIDGAEISDKETITHLYVAKDVTKIEDNAFPDCIALTTVELAEATSIGNNAFSGCTALTTVKMTKVTTIGFLAFAYCEALVNLTVGTTPPKVGIDAFKSCPANKTLTIDGGNPPEAVNEYNIDFRDGKAGDDLWYGWALPELPTNTVTVNDGTGSKDYRAGETVTIKANTSPTGKRFKAWTVTGDTVKLENVANESTTFIMPACPVEITATYEDSSVVYGVLKSYNKVYQTNSDNTRTDGALIDKKTVTHLFVTDEVTTIDIEAFSDCAALITVDMPNVVTIDREAFSDCTALTTVDMPNVTSIGFGAFYKCEKLTTVVTPNVTEIVATAFSGCTALTTVVIPNVAELKVDAFSGCTALKTVTMPAVTKIFGGAFYECKSLETVTIPAVTEIGPHAFTGCIALTTVDMPAVTSIDTSAFGWCTALTTAEIPAVTEIGESAFKECNALANLTVGATPPTVGTDAFKGCLRTNPLIIVGGNTPEAIADYDSKDGNTNDDFWYGWSLSGKVSPPASNTYTVSGRVKDEKNSIKVDAIVKLMKGGELIDETTTNFMSSFVFTGIPNGAYNLVVVSTDGISITTIVMVNGADKGIGTITFPIGKTISLVVVKPNTPTVAIGNLENQFSNEDKVFANANPNNKVEIKLVVEKKTESTVKADADKIVTVANGKKVGLYLDLSVFKTETTDGNEETPKLMITTPSVIEVVVPLSADLKSNTELTVCRVHNGIAQTLPKDEANKNADGEYFEVYTDNIIIYTKNFSTYAIVYKDTPTNGGGSEPNFPVIEKLIFDLPSIEDFKEINLPEFEIIEIEYKKLTNDEKLLIDEFLHNKYKAIATLAETMRKVAVKPGIIKTLPAKPTTPTKNPKTGDSTPMSLPIIFATLGLALIALGFYLKNKGKQQLAK